VNPVLPSTADLAAPPVFLPYQRAWVEDKSQLKICEKSRRTGLTWAEAADDVLTAAADKTGGGQNVYYIGYNQDMAIEFIEACAMWARAFHHAASEVQEGFWEDGGDDKHIKTYTIRFPESSHRIVALSSRPANLRGKQGTVVIDEAAFHGELGELLKAAMALLIWGGRVRVISTHNGDSNPFNELIGDIRAGKRRGTVHRITFDEAVSQGLYQRVCLRMDKPWTAEGETAWMESVYAFYGADAAEELDVVPRQSGGAYLTRALIESRMEEVPVLRLEVDDAFAHGSDDNRRREFIHAWCREHLDPVLASLDVRLDHCFGEDFGRSGDLTVLALFARSRDLVCRCVCLIELRNVPFREQEAVLFYAVDRLPRFRFGALDARGNGQYLAERAQQRYGAMRIAQVMLSEPWYAEHMPRFRAAFEDGTITAPRDADVLDDLRAIEVIRGVPRIPPGSTSKRGGRRHGDAAIAMVLGHFAYRQDPAPIGFLAAGERRTLDAFADGFMAGSRDGHDWGGWNG
jgi:phage FluMu gp28-like protein